MQLNVVCVVKYCMLFIEMRENILIYCVFFSPTDLLQLFIYCEHNPMKAKPHLIDLVRCKTNIPSEANETIEAQKPLRQLILLAQPCSN